MWLILQKCFYDPTYYHLDYELFKQSIFYLDNLICLWTLTEPDCMYDIIILNHTITIPRELPFPMNIILLCNVID